MLEAALQRALDDGIAPGLVHFILGTRSLSAGDMSQAILHLEVAAQLDVDVPETLNNLAWALAQSDEPELKRALALVERALQQKKRPEFFGTRGFILKEMGQRYAAIASFELSLPGHPDKEFVKKHLRELYSQP